MLGLTIDTPASFSFLVKRLQCTLLALNRCSCINGETEWPACIACKQKQNGTTVQLAAAVLSHHSSPCFSWRHSRHTHIVHGRPPLFSFTMTGRQELKCLCTPCQYRSHPSGCASCDVLARFVRASSRPGWSSRLIHLSVPLDFTLFPLPRWNSHSFRAS